MKRFIQMLSGFAVGFLTMVGATALGFNVIPGFIVSQIACQSLVWSMC